VTQFGRFGHGRRRASVNSPVGPVMVQAIKIDRKGSAGSMVCKDIDNHHSLLNFSNGCLHCAAGRTVFSLRLISFYLINLVILFEKNKEGLIYKF